MTNQGRGVLALLNDDDRTTLRSHGTLREHRRGARLTSEGRSSGDVHVLWSGYATIARDGADGRVTVISVVGPGALLGQDALIGQPNTSTTTMITDGVSLRLHASLLLLLADTNPRLASALTTTLVAQVSALADRVARYGTLSVRERVEQQLVELAAEFGRPHGDSVVIEVPLTQDELASLVGTTRETYNRTLRLLTSEGSVRRQRGTLHLRAVGA